MRFLSVFKEEEVAPDMDNLLAKVLAPLTGINLTGINLDFTAGPAKLLKEGKQSKIKIKLSSRHSGQ